MSEIGCPNESCDSSALPIESINELFFFFTSVNICLLVAGFTILLFILCEAYYVKAFLALSSILNTLFVFLAMSGANTTDLALFL